MRSVPISSFKVRCLAVLRSVHKTGKPVRVTRFGKPLVDIFPATARQLPGADWIGRMRGTGEILGDIVAPIAR